MMLINSPSPGENVEVWKAWRTKLKSMRSSDIEVRRELARADKMIEMLSTPVTPLSAEQLREIFKD